MRPGRRALLAALGLLALAAVVQLGVLRSLDRQLLTLVQSVARHEFDLAGSILTVLGSPEVTAGLAAGLVVARLRARRRDFWVPLAIALVVVIESVLKTVIAQPEPPLALARGIDLLPGVQAPFPYSFPSGHVARDTFLLLIVQGWPRIAVGLALLLVALTRVYLGEHWPSDVLGGLLLGATLAWAAGGAHRRIAQT